MCRFTEVSLRSTSFTCLIHFRKILPILGFMVAAASTSSAVTLSRVSCGTNAYSGTGTDACSVYLAAHMRTRTYVTLSSNNPAVTVPSRVTVRSGAMSAGFGAAITSVTTTQTATITAQAGGTSAQFNITLSPSTTGGAGVSVNATSISFGSVALNTTVAQPVIVSSTGSAPLTVNSALVSGAGFSVSGVTLPATLNPGQSSTLEVQFDPTTATSYSGQLAISTSVSSPTVTLSGTGAGYAVDLSWSAPTGSTDPVAGYNVYRAPSGTTSFQRLNTTVDTLTTYTDPSVQTGASYSYYVTSVDPNGVESTPSNTFTLAIP